jgi:fumarate reductase subunit C
MFLSHAKISRGFVKNRLKIASETKEWQKFIQTLDNLVIYRLNIIETDFRLGKTTSFEHFYQIFAVVKHAIRIARLYRTGAL